MSEDTASNKARIIISSFLCFSSGICRACRFLPKVVVIVIASLSLASLAGTVTLVTFDGKNESSLVEGAHWSDGQPPSAGNDYVSAKLIRTPPVATNIVFAGDSLTLNSNGVLFFKGLGLTSVFSFRSLTMNGTAYVYNGMGVDTYFYLSGDLELGSSLSNGFWLNNAGNGGGFAVSAVISGIGQLRVYSNGSSLSPVAIALTNPGNSYSGGTLVSQYGYLDVKNGGTLGTSKVTVAPGALLKLEHGTAIDNAATLELQIDVGRTGRVDLADGVVENVGRISLGGIPYTQQGMSFGSTSSGAQYQDDNYFTGSGIVRIQPAPGTVVAVR